MNKTDYVSEYYEKNYSDGEVDVEIESVGRFLIENAKGKVLDLGCGPVPQVWSIFMPHATEISAVDLPEESIEFAKKKIATVVEWKDQFIEYKELVEKVTGPKPESYIEDQVRKITFLAQADMTKDLPFEDNSFDVAVSTYSLCCLQNEAELESAILNIKKILKPGGKLLHMNTNGNNSNTVVPEYTGRGLKNSNEIIVELLEKHGFEDVQSRKVDLESDQQGMFKYSSIFLFSAAKSLQ